MARDARVNVKIEVAAADAGARLDRLLRKLLPGVPLSRLHAMLRKGEVRRLSGGRPSRMRAPDRLEAGEILSLALARGDAEALDARPSAGPARGLAVLYEDEHLLAFDKPAGVACHPGSGHPLGATVLGELRARAAPAGDGRAAFRPALVGRLDRDASGVQLAGKSPEGLRGLEKLSRGRSIEKTYLVLVCGRDLPARGTVDAPLRDRGSGRARMEAARPPDGPPAPAPNSGALVDARTAFRVLVRGEGPEGAALVEVSPETGRRHQIRAHMRSLGAPVAGDARYGDMAWNRELKRRAALGRLFLHCNEVRFPHPATGRRVRVISPLPDELRRTLEALGIGYHPARGR